VVIVAMIRRVYSSADVRVPQQLVANACCGDSTGAQTRTTANARVPW